MVPDCFDVPVGAANGHCPTRRSAHHHALDDGLTADGELRISRQE